MRFPCSAVRIWFSSVVCSVKEVKYSDSAVILLSRKVRETGWIPCRNRGSRWWWLPECDCQGELRWKRRSPRTEAAHRWWRRRWSGERVWEGMVRRESRLEIGNEWLFCVEEGGEWFEVRAWKVWDCGKRGRRSWMLPPWKLKKTWWRRRRWRWRLRVTKEKQEQTQGLDLYGILNCVLGLSKPKIQ